MADSTKQMTMQDQRAENIPKVDRYNFYTNFIVLHTIVTLKQHTQLDQQYRKYKLKKQKQKTSITLSSPGGSDLYYSLSKEVH